MHMPIDLFVSYEDGTEAYFYIPIVAMRGAKESGATLLKIGRGWLHNIVFQFKKRSNLLPSIR
jgi:hypothetical protein